MCQMNKGYIYLISFDGNNDIYIGLTTKSINKRFKEHKKSGTVFEYVSNNLNYDWSKVHIDIIDTVDMDKDLTHLINHPLNTMQPIVPTSKIILPKYTSIYNTQYQLVNFKLRNMEMFHIHNYKNEGKYNLINKKIDYFSNRDYMKYNFFNYAK